MSRRAGARGFPYPEKGKRGSITLGARLDLGPGSSWGRARGARSGGFLDWGKFAPVQASASAVQSSSRWAPATRWARGGLDSPQGVETLEGGAGFIPTHFRTAGPHVSGGCAYMGWPVSISTASNGKRRSVVISGHFVGMVAVAIVSGRDKAPGPNRVILSWLAGLRAFETSARSGFASFS